AGFLFPTRWVGFFRRRNRAHPELFEVRDRNSPGWRAARLGNVCHTAHVNLHAPGTACLAVPSCQLRSSFQHLAGHRQRLWVPHDHVAAWDTSGHVQPCVSLRGDAKGQVIVFGRAFANEHLPAVHHDRPIGLAFAAHRLIAETSNALNCRGPTYLKQGPPPIVTLARESRCPESSHLLRGRTSTTSGKPS